jgi:hypothetical protein
LSPFGLLHEIGSGRLSDTVLILTGRLETNAPSFRAHEPCDSGVDEVLKAGDVVGRLAMLRLVRVGFF